MAISLVRFGLRSAVSNLERSAAVISCASAQNQLKVRFLKSMTMYIVWEVYGWLRMKFAVI